MRIPAIYLIHKFGALLAALLCFAITLCTSGNAQAAPVAPCQSILSLNNSEDPDFILSAGELESGETEAVLQLKKSLLIPLFQAVLAQLYPPQYNFDFKLSEHPFSGSDCGKHSSLTKGP